MYPVSDRFLTRLAESDSPPCELTLFRTDGKIEALELVGGTVTVDRGQAIRRTCSITVADRSLIPRTARDKLSVYGSRLRVSRGVSYQDGTRELVPLGLFRVDSVDGDPDFGPVTVEGQSLEVGVADDLFTAPYRATGTAVGAATALIQRSLPDATVVSHAQDAVIGSRTWDVQADPWAAARECAAAIGCEVWTDADGIFHIGSLPDLLTSPPVWTVAAGEGGVLVSAKRGMSSEKVHNGVLARGENSESDAPPVQYLAVDNDPSSPTYWDGPFGHRPTIHSSSTLTTVNACAQAAALQLAAARQPNATGDISSLPNSALEPGDVLRVVYGDSSKDLHQVQAYRCQLEPGGDFTINTISAKEDG